MDALIIILVACILCLKNEVKVDVVEERVLARETRLNPEFYVDENAFMEVANALGFGINSPDTGGSDVDMRDQFDDDIPVNTASLVRNQSNRNSYPGEDADGAGGRRIRHMDRVARSDG